MPSLFQYFDQQYNTAEEKNSTYGDTESSLQHTLTIKINLNFHNILWRSCQKWAFLYYQFIHHHILQARNMYLYYIHLLAQAVVQKTSATNIDKLNHFQSTILPGISS